jgi:hypothetical protein
MNARFVPVIGGIALVTLLAGCGSASGPNSGTFHPSGASSPTDATSDAAAGSGSSAAPVPSAMTTQQLKQSVLAGYRAYQKAYETAYRTNDPAGLAAVAIDPLLARVTKDVEKTAAGGEIWRFHNVLSPQIQSHSQDSTTIVVVDCLKTLGAFRFNAKTGQRLGSLPGGSALYQAIMKYTDGTWKVSDGIQGKKC